MENLSYQMVNNIPVNLKKVESMDMELINGRMEISTQVIFSKTIDKDQVHINGMIKVTIKDNGNLIE